MKDDITSSSWTDPDDAPPLGSDWFADAELRDGNKVVRRGRPVSPNAKKSVTLRLDPDLIDWFRNKGPGWQTRINEALRKVANI